jgi:hypothetical protein
MIDSIARRHSDAAFVLAIVFPELIRYSALREQIEVMALSTLYVQYGPAYSDFSVGNFQMKPSFVEQVESDMVHDRIPGWQKYDPDADNDSETRLRRIKGLKSLPVQLNYLLDFCKLLDHRYKNVHWKSDEEKLRFFATAYNLGYNSGEEKIIRNLSMKYFHTEVFSGVEKYCYADIAIFFYRQMKGV